MSAHILLNLLNKLRKRDKILGLLNILLLFATSFINSIIQEHQLDTIYHVALKLL